MEQTLYGRLIKKRLLGSINFLEIVTSRNVTTQVTIEDKNLLKNVRNGSILKFEGVFKKTNLSHTYNVEFHASNIEVIANNYEHLHIHPTLTLDTILERGDSFKQMYVLASDKMKLLLKVKNHIIECIRDYFNNKDFIEIQSPKIVDSLVEGPTNAFEVECYSRKAYLSISNVLYHHMLITAGYNKIYEISPLFRQQPYKSKYQLSEFWTLDFSEAWKERDDMIKNLEGLLHFVVNSLHEKFNEHLTHFEINLPELPSQIEKVGYIEMLEWLNLKNEDYGTHLPHRLIKELKRKGLSILWIIDAPTNKKPFFVKRKNNTSLSAELWTIRVPILASGGERVTDYKEALKNISNLDMNSKNFETYLNMLKFGAPPSYTIGVGIERLLQYLTLQPLYSLIPFPRFPKTKIK